MLNTIATGRFKNIYLGNCSHGLLTVIGAKNVFDKYDRTCMQNVDLIFQNYMGGKNKVNIGVFYARSVPEVPYDKSTEYIVFACFADVVSRSQSGYVAPYHYALINYLHNANAASS